MLLSGVESNVVELLDSNVIVAPVPYAPVVDHGARMAALIESIRSDLQSVQCPVRNHFAPGVYGREMFHHAGTVIVGKIHKHQNMLVMLQGEAVLVDASGRRTVRAPQVWITPPGVQRAAIAITDCIWMSVHGTHETDLEKIEAEFIAQDALEYEQFLLQHNKGA